MIRFKNFLIGMGTPRRIVISRGSVIVVALAMIACLGTTLAAAPFFATESLNGLLGGLARRSSIGQVETETADDFALQEMTIITGATITGLIPLGTPLDIIRDVEVEVSHVFPLDAVNPPSGNVPTRTDWPSDLEIRTATRARSAGTLGTDMRVLNKFCRSQHRRQQPQPQGGRRGTGYRSGIGGVSEAASALGFSGVDALQNGLALFCE